MSTTTRYSYEEYLRKFAPRSTENEDAGLRTPEEEGKVLADETIEMFREALGCWTERKECDAATGLSSSDH